MSPSSNDSSSDVLGPAAALPNTAYHPGSTRTETAETDPYRLRGVESGSRAVSGANALPTTYDDGQQRYMVGPQSQPAARQDVSQPTQPMQTQSFVMPMQPQQQPASMHQQQAPVPQHYQQPTPIATAQQPYPEDDDAMASPDFNRHNSTYGDWLGGAALGAGAGALGTEAYRRYQRDETVPEDNVARSADPTSSKAAYQPATMDEPTATSLPPADTTAIPAAASAGNVAPSTAPFRSLGSDANYPKAQDTAPAFGSVPMNNSTVGNSTLGDTGSRLGGLESRGAHETGRIFPSVVRHDTDMSVSGLHVPGEFPKRG